MAHSAYRPVTRMDAAYLLNTRAAQILDRDGLDAERMEEAMVKQFGNEIAHQVADTNRPAS